MQKIKRSLVTSLIVGLLPAASWGGPVDINSADAETLAAELDGVGLAKARAIVEYRNQNGAFSSPEDLGNVKGIGPKVLDENRGNIRVGPGTAEPRAAD